MELTAKRKDYIGLFFVTLATLVFQTLLSRIFSVTMWYHYAFVAISVAMFGMTFGAMLVYLLPHRFPVEKTDNILARSSLWFSITIIFAYLAHASLPFSRIHSNFIVVFSLFLNYSIIAIPFIFSGICVSLVLTRFPKQVNKLYAVDLAGAGLGCLLLIAILSITEGPTAVVLTAIIAGIGSLFFAQSDKKLFKRILIIVTIMLAFATISHISVIYQKSILRPVWVKGEFEERPMYEKWNTFSRIKVMGDTLAMEKPFTWGISSKWKDSLRIHQLKLDIDANAATWITNFEHDSSKLRFLEYDVTNVAHYLRHNIDVMVVGAGGGRDLLSALYFGQKSVTGVEINDAIFDVLRKRFGDFSCHVADDPRVHLVNDEARSYAARIKDTFGLLQVSLIDTWAATTAGAYVLSENALYTVEAWKIFFDRLTSDGIISFSRWKMNNSLSEQYRTVSLAAASLRESGIDNPRAHIVVISNIAKEQEESKVLPAIGTILISKKEFTKIDLDTLDSLAARMNFSIDLSPRKMVDEMYEKVINPEKYAAFFDSYPLNLFAPRDENPFFFQILKFSSLFNGRAVVGSGDFNYSAVYLLATLILIVALLTFVCIIVPLIISRKKFNLKGAGMYFPYFAGIGLGFMFVEISQMQRLIVFLGHPVYGLSVLLFSLLVSSGIGSFFSSFLKTRMSQGIALAVLVGVAIIFGELTPHIVANFQSETTAFRIFIAVSMIMPLGFFMGMPFPIGMKSALSFNNSIAPWLWGINGAMSVMASTLAVAISIGAGISVSYWTGIVAYIIAISSYIYISRKRTVAAD